MTLLNKVSERQQPPPPRITIYGPEKIGKSTFASDAPKPVALDLEGGFEYIEIPRFRPESLEQVFEFIEELISEKHSYKTLVIDSADWLERMIQQVVAQEENKKDISDVPYGGGYKKAATIFDTLLKKLDQLRHEKNMAIIFTAHDHIKRFDDPVNDSYDRHQLKLHEQIHALLKEWCECILFATSKIYTTSKKEGFNKDVTKARGGTERVLKTVGYPAYVAGNRLGLPDELPLDWLSLQDAMIDSVNPKKEKKDG